MSASLVHESATTTVLLNTDVCVDGTDYGPDFGSPIAEIPSRWARKFIRRGEARIPFLGPCTRETKRCDTATLPQLETARCCIDAALETLWKIQEVFDHYGIRWWIDYGTLLGAAKGGAFYWNDKDCDIGVLADDQEKVLRTESIFTDAGFPFLFRAGSRQRFGGGDSVKIRWSGTNKANTDVFFWHKAGSVYDRRNYIPVDRFKGREFPAEWLFPLVQVEFEGRLVPAPKEWRHLVAHRYGAGWEDLPALRTDRVER